MRINEGNQNGQTVVPVYKPPTTTTTKPPQKKPGTISTNPGTVTNLSGLNSVAVGGISNLNNVPVYTPGQNKPKFNGPVGTVPTRPNLANATLAPTAPVYNPSLTGNWGASLIGALSGGWGGGALNNGGRPNTPIVPVYGGRPGMANPPVTLVTPNGGQTITANPNVPGADGVNGRYVPEYIGNGGPGPGDPGYAATTINYGSPLNNPGFGAVITGGGVLAPTTPTSPTGNPNDPNNPLNGLDPNYNTNGRGGNVDFNDADWNPGLPYRTGGYDLAEVMNNSAGMYQTGFNYANNFKGAYMGQIEGYDNAGNPLPQIAGYYVYNGRYYPINLRKFNQQNNTPTWQQYTGTGGGSGNGGSGGGGGGGVGGSSPVTITGNQDYFQQALNWKI